MRDPGLIKRGPRFDVAHDCSLVDGAGEERRVRVTDISRYGYKIEGRVPLGIGEHVVIRLGSQGDKAAQIRWALGNFAGAAFAEPLALADD